MPTPEDPPTELRKPTELEELTELTEEEEAVVAAILKQMALTRERMAFARKESAERSEGSRVLLEEMAAALEEQRELTRRESRMRKRVEFEKNLHEIAQPKSSTGYSNYDGGPRMTQPARSHGLLGGPLVRTGAGTVGGDD